MSSPIQSLVSDPDFGKLSPDDQRSALSRVDPDIGKLSDPDFGTFVTKAQGRAFSASQPPGIQRIPDSPVGADLGVSSYPDYPPGPFERAHPTISKTFMGGWELGPSSLDIPAGPIVSNALRTAGKVATDLPLLKQAGTSAARAGIGATISHYLHAPPWMTEMVGLGSVAKDLPELKATGSAALERARATNPVDPVWRAPEPPVWEGIPAPSRTVTPPVEPVPSVLPSGRVPGGIQNQLTNVIPPGTTSLPNGEFMAPKPAIAPKPMPITSIPSVSPTPEFSGSATSGVPVHYQTAGPGGAPHPNPTAAFATDKDVIGWLKTRGITEPSANDIQNARVGTGHARARSGDIDGILDRVKRTMGVLK
jgi:hypothetical protein